MTDLWNGKTSKNIKMHKTLKYKITNAKHQNAQNVKYKKIEFLVS